jgi:hypothetical protein
MNSDITVTLKDHLSALIEANDRRYAEVSAEREKALKIKDEADKTALGLAREIQTYKDEKANELRSQIERERGSYASQADLRASVEKLEAIIKPLSEYVSSQQGRSGGLSSGWGYLVGAVGLASAVISIVIVLTR